MPGVIISDGAIFADFVVVNDVPAYSIVGRNPAKIIKHRFATETIQTLLEITEVELGY